MLAIIHCDALLTICSRNTAEPALPGRWCCPRRGGWRSDTKCAEPGGVPITCPGAGTPSAPSARAGGSLLRPIPPTAARR
ncbi:hypothetical protein EJO70_06440 [Variovorax sp. 553]|nr:hypothetical protein EJO70_06440 [Variovorax sp. 553]RSZ46454.1 hypothetical protein EJO71_04870 [Variovorax sp. 679]